MAAGALWHTRPIFITSTFRDMQAERDWLRLRVFPVLEERLRARRTHLEPIDLRWGVETVSSKEEEAKELLVLKVCLAEVERSRPFLIGLIGDRYGWIPPQERIAAAAREAGFEQPVTGRSVTDMEIDFGVLSSADQRHRCRFYFREALPYDALIAAGQMTPQTAAEYSEAHRPDDDAGIDRLDVLKRRIEQTLPERVRRYRTEWDPARQTVTGLEAWGEQVLEDLWRELDPETAAWAREGEATWEVAERFTLEQFIEDRTRDFVGRETILHELESLATSPAQEGQAWGACVTAEAGAGKSALFAELTRRLQEKNEIVVLSHAAGISPRSTQVDAMLRRWIGELEHIAGVAEPLAEDAKADEVEQTFQTLLGRVSTKRRVVMLIDALNQFEPTPRAKHLTWLPKLWPPNVRLITTAIQCTASESLSQRPGVEAETLPPLDTQEAASIATGICKRYRRTLHPEVLACLLKKQQSDNTLAAGNALWLQLAVEELNLLDADDFARLEREFQGNAEQKLHQLLLAVIEAMPADVEGLYGWLLERAEQLYGEPWAQSFVNLIAVSRAGWRESDFRVLIPKLCNTAWDELKFAALRRTFRTHVVQCGALAQWDFTHAQMREAVQRFYLGDVGKVRVLHATIATHLESHSETDPVRCQELMWHLLVSDDLPRVATYFSAEMGAEEIYGAEAALSSFLDQRTVNDQGFASRWVQSILKYDGLSDAEIGILHARLGDQLMHNYDRRDLATALEAYRSALAARIAIGVYLDPGVHPLPGDELLSTRVIQVNEGTLRLYQTYRDNLAVTHILRNSMADHYAELWDEAWRLYQTGKELEALDILDSSIGVPKHGLTLDRVRKLVGSTATEDLDPTVRMFLFVRDDARVGDPTRVFLSLILNLMGMSFAALLDSMAEAVDSAMIVRAENYVDTVMKLFPNDARFLTLAAQITAGLGDPDRALEICDWAMRSDPGFEQAFVTTTMIRRRIRDAGAGSGTTNGVDAGSMSVSGWRTAGGSMARTGVRPDTVVLPLTIKWTFEPENWLVHEIVCSNSIAVFSDMGRTLYAVELNEGRLLWRREFRVEIGTAEIGEGAVIIGTSTDVFCFELRSGEERWRTTANHAGRPFLQEANCPLWLPIDSNILRVAGLRNKVFFADNEIAVFDARTGEKLYTTTKLYESHPGTGPCADADYVYLPYSTRELLRVRITTGEFVDPISVNGKICAGPVIYDSVLLYGSNRRNLQAIDLHNNLPRWTLDFSGDHWFVNSRPAVDGGMAYVGSPGGTVYAVRIEDGEVIWEVKCPGGIDAALLATARTVFVLTTKGLYGLGKESGLIAWSYEPDRNIYPGCPPVYANGLILVGWDKLYAFASA